ncbi:MAG: response regulator [Gammaproteobacteria bacterium]
MSQTVLIVEDEQKVADLLADYMKQSGYNPEIEQDGSQALQKFEQVKPDIVLLDVMLPGKDGMEICRDIRKQSNVPIIMITARVEEVDRLLGLELGADDYICKPFSPREVVARVKAILRRINNDNHSSQSTLQLDASRHVVTINAQQAELTAVEFKLLQILADDSGRIYSRTKLMDSIYDDHRVVSDRTIDSHIKKLRKKLTNINDGEDIIRSVYGVGYKLEI